MKNVYFVQVNDFYGSGRKSTYIPYAAGCVQAYCRKSEVIAANYRFGRIVYCRDALPAIVSRFEDPFMVLFSCSVWNTEFNKALAKAVKAAYPACLILFGGHHVSSDRSFLAANPFVDFVIHNGGEEPAAQLLEHLALGQPLSDVPNLSYRNEDGAAVTTPILPQTGSDYPSPYLEGIFDDILSDDVAFSVILETNRGCPNSCAFCDWGQLKSKVRLFPLTRVFAEIDWIAAHKIEYVYCADANFCLFSRDAQIVDYIINSNKTTGYPKIFHVNFTKNRTDFVFDISTRMMKEGLAKAQTIAFQSMAPEALENIGRKNMPISHFRSLMRRFNENHISTYSELILGLPGETYNSFVDGMCALIENGQHFAVYVYPCEVFPNSEISQPWYREKYKIGTTRVPFQLMHTNGAAEYGVTEYVDVVTSTGSMNADDWVRTYLFASLVQGFHNLGYLRCVAIWCRYALNFGYRAFYEGLVSYAGAHPGAFLSRLVSRVETLCRGVGTGSNPFVAPCEGAGDVLWGFEELAAIETYKNLDAFYEEVRAFIAARFGESEELAAVMRYQKDIMKKIGVTDVRICSDYDFYAYFGAVYKNEPAPLARRRVTLTLRDPKPVDSLAAYARETVWYGRNRQETDYTSHTYPLQYIIETDPSVGDAK